jgi:hypothetical protein
VSWGLDADPSGIHDRWYEPGPKKWPRGQPAGPRSGWKPWYVR